MRCNSIRFLRAVGLLAVAAWFVPQSQADYISAVIGSSPVGYYQMNETTGSYAINSVDESGTTDGDYREGGTPSAQPPDAAGPVLNQAGPRYPAFAGFSAGNASVGFDGAGEAAPSDNMVASALSLNDSAYTFEAWIYNSRSNNDRMITGYVGGRGTTTGYDTIGIGGTYYGVKKGALFFFNSATLINGTTVLALDTWYHVAYTRDGSAVNVYLNGAPEISGTISSLYGTSDRIEVGCHPGENWGFKGQIDEVAVYNGALSGEVIAAHYAAATTPEPGTLALLAMGLIGLLAYAWRKRK